MHVQSTLSINKFLFEMSSEVWIIITALILINGVWIICRNRYRHHFKDESEKAGNTEGIQEQSTWYTWVFSISLCLDIWIIGACITHIWSRCFFVDVPPGESREALFGDSFGAVNALVSAFAFAGMIVSFVLQRSELRLQRKELEAQRKEFEQQNDTLALQRFENTFFHMLELQQQIVNNLEATWRGKDEMRKVSEVGGYVPEEVGVERVTKGRDVFQVWFTGIKVGKQIFDGEIKWLEKNGIREYDSSYIPSIFDHYFRHLYNIVKFVDQTQILSDEDKYRYVSITRSTLSRYELVWLYYNTLSNLGCLKFKPLVEKYCLLNNLRPDLLALSYENRVYLSEAGFKTYQPERYSGRDFEFFLTEIEGDIHKYHLSAFYRNEELESGFQKLNQWRQEYGHIEQ